MTTDFTPEEIRQREALWSAAKAGSGIEFTPEAAKLLWASLLKTGVELSFLRDGVKQLQSPVTGTDAPVQKCRYTDCVEQHPVAGDDEQVTCPSCRTYLGV